MLTVRSPEGQTVVHFPRVLLVLPTAFSGGHISDHMPKASVVGGGDPADLGEAGGEAISSHTMKSLTPPLVRRPLDSVNAPGAVDEEHRLFVFCEVGHKQVYSLGDVLAVVAPGVLNAVAGSLECVHTPDGECKQQK